MRRSATSGFAAEADSCWANQSYNRGCTTGTTLVGDRGIGFVPSLLDGAIGLAVELGGGHTGANGASDPDLKCSAGDLYDV